MKKIMLNSRGFTLTEVMIGMTILTIAIVSATSLLVGLIGTNQNNVHTLQANYLAMEGVEAVRNIRDTNWLHNRDWLGESSTALWGEKFIVPNDMGGENLYQVDLQNGAFSQAVGESGVDGVQALSGAKTWNVSGGEGGNLKWVNGEESEFKRIISIKKYDCGEVDCSNYVLVTARVSWFEGAKPREVEISELLTNWKGGAL